MDEFLLVLPIRESWSEPPKETKREHVVDEVLEGSFLRGGIKGNIEYFFGEIDLKQCEVGPCQFRRMFYSFFKFEGKYFGIVAFHFSRSDNVGAGKLGVLRSDAMIVISRLSRHIESELLKIVSNNIMEISEHEYLHYTSIIRLRKGAKNKLKSNGLLGEFEYASSDKIEHLLVVMGVLVGTFLIMWDLKNYLEFKMFKELGKLSRFSIQDLVIIPQMAKYNLLSLQVVKDIGVFRRRDFVDDVKEMYCIDEYRKYINELLNTFNTMVRDILAIKYERGTADTLQTMENLNVLSESLSLKLNYLFILFTILSIFSIGADMLNMLATSTTMFVILLMVIILLLTILYVKVLGAHPRRMIIGTYSIDISTNMGILEEKPKNTNGLSVRVGQEELKIEKLKLKRTFMQVLEEEVIVWYHMLLKIRKGNKKSIYNVATKMRGYMQVGSTEVVGQEIKLYELTIDVKNVKGNQNITLTQLKEIIQKVLERLLKDQKPRASQTKNLM